MRFVIAIQPRNDLLPAWIARAFGLLLFLMLALASVCLAIVFYAVVSVALGIGGAHQE